MQSQCFSHNLEFHTDIYLRLYRTMDSKKTSWIYYSTCAVQVLQETREAGRASRARCCPWLWAGGSSRSCFCEPLAGFGPAAPAGAAGAQNSFNSRHKLIQECESYQEEGVLEIREPFCSVLITQIAANINY